MKHFTKIFIPALIAIAAISTSYAYEVYEHNQGDTNHLVSEGKVMGATLVRIGDISIQTNYGTGDFNVESTRKKDSSFALFDHKQDGTYVEYRAGNFTMVGGDWGEGPIFLTVEYCPNGTNKLYKVKVRMENGTEIVTEGIPTFYKCDKYGMNIDVIGSEQSVGVHPVFLDWLEHWAKKKKFKSQK